MTDAIDWVPESIRMLSAYKVQETAGVMVKLDAMENPYPLPQELRALWQDCLAGVDVNRYPDSGCRGLKTAIREVFAPPTEASILLGNGSDELIQMIAMLVGGEGKTFIAPKPSFAMYELIAKVTGTAFTGIPLESDLTVNASAFVEQVRQIRPACVFLACPNNPTGNHFPSEFVEEVIRAAPGLVVVDEAYHAFSGRSYLDLVSDHANLLVMRTLSKSGIAGLRLGMLFGSPDWLEQLEKVRLPYNINSLTQAGARLCIEHYGAFEQQIREIIANRSDLMNELNQRRKIRPFPSEANFILFRVADADSTFAKLKQQGVLIKNFNGSDPLLSQCLRVTVGSREENAQFLSALDQSI